MIKCISANNKFVDLVEPFNLPYLQNVVSSTCQFNPVALFCDDFKRLVRQDLGRLVRKLGFLNQIILLTQLYLGNCYDIIELLLLSVLSVNIPEPVRISKI